MHDRSIAGPEPAIRKGRGGGLCVLVVARHDRIAANGNLTLREAIARDRPAAGAVDHGNLFDHRQGVPKQVKGP